MTTTQGNEVTEIKSPAGHTYYVTAQYQGDYSGAVVVTPSSYVVTNAAGAVQWTYHRAYGVQGDIRRDIERGKWDPKPEASVAEPDQTPFVAPLGWVQDVDIPVAHTEGGVVLDLSSFLPDLIREVRRHGFDTDRQVFEALQKSGRATPHLSMDAADALASDLVRALTAAEQAGTVTEPADPKGI